MSPRRAICVSQDHGLRPAVEAAITGAGLAIEHLDALPDDLVDLAGAALVIIDRPVRQAAGARLHELAVPVIVVGDDLDDDGLIALMLEAPVSHLVEDARHPDLGITSEKLVSGDVFGLEKYISGGARVGERMILNDVDKRFAMAEVCAWAESVGARAPVLHRIASVVDELVMNALRDAPEDDLSSRACATLRWAADDRTLAISVGDSYGELSQRDVIDHILRARHERGRPNPRSDGGAGLGLYLVLANVASLVVNVAPGRKTEVVCLFDLALGTRPHASRVRSLHVFAGAG